MESTEPVVLEADQTVTHKAEEFMDLARSMGWSPTKQERQEPEPKTWFTDPYQLLDSVGLGYRQSPSSVTYDTLLQMSERNPIIASVLQTRLNQVASFLRLQANKYSVGLRIYHRDRRKKLTDDDRKHIKYLERFLLNTGAPYRRDRDSLEQFGRKFARDRLVFDQACAEKVRGVPVDYGKNGKLLQFLAAPSASMRVAQPKSRKGTPNYGDKQIAYTQLINGKIVEKYTADELMFCVANPRSDISVFKYGYSELEMLINTVTAHLWAEQWNREQFRNGATIKGVLNVKGNMPPAQMEAFKRAWALQVAGVNNAHKTPMLNAEGIEWFPLQLSNTEMGYQMWLEYLIKVVCAVYGMDPSEINFDLRGGAGMNSPMFMSSNEAQQKLSKDRGLRPLLRFFADNLNRHIVWEINPNFELDFVGLDAKTEEQAIELRLKEVTNYKTINEVRAEDDLPPIDGGDIILNPTFTGFKSQQAMMAQQGGAGGAPGAPGAPPGGEGPPGAGGAPPGAPGAPGSPQEAPQQAVEHRPGATATPDGKPKPFEQEEGKAAKVLHAKANGEDEESSDNHPDLMSEDWESTIRASVKPMDTLRKSLSSFLEGGE